MDATAYPANKTFGTNAGFDTGIDILDKTLRTYFAFENAKVGLEYQQATAQQARLENAINTEQQINDRIYETQGRASSLSNEQKIGMGVVAAILAALAYMAK